MVKYLLEETDLTPDNLLKSGEVSMVISDNEREKFKLGREEFLGLLPSGLSGWELVKEVYSISDEITEDYLKDHPIACGQGCSYCCHQLVCCSRIEMQLIEKYLKSMLKPRFSRIKEKAKKQCKKFFVIYKGMTANQIPGVQQKDTNFRAAILWRGEACPYLLKNGSCGIYPVRPIDCRNARTRVRCGEEIGDENNLDPLRLVIDQIASDVIADESAKSDGSIYVVPIMFWPLTEEFSHIFKILK